MPTKDILPRWLVAPCLLFLLVGCSSNGNKNDGPLVVAGEPSDVCVVQPDQGKAAVGSVVHNEGKQVLVIEGLDLVDAEDLSLEGGHILPLNESRTFVLGAGSTEPSEPDAAAAWEYAEEPGAFELAPGDSANVIVAIDNASARSGTAKAIRVTYSENESDYSADTNTTITLADGSCF
jgi:hypothetical protein